jgi:hypothetical protein
MAKGAVLVKVIVATANSLIIVGALVAAVVLSLHAGRLSYKDFAAATLTAKFLLAVAILAIVAAIFGLVSVCVWNKFVRFVYFAFVFIVIVLEAVGIAIAYLYPARIEAVIQEKWLDHQYRDLTLDLERKFKCCGWDNETYEHTDIHQCGLENATLATPNCRDAILEDVKAHQTKVAVALIVLIVFEVVLLVCAIYLLCEKPDDGDGITKF